MDRVLAPPTVPLSTFGRLGERLYQVPFDRRMRRYPKCHVLEARVEQLARAWPVAAEAVDRVVVSSRLPKPEYARSHVVRFCTVSGTITVAGWALRDPLIDAELLGFQVTGWSVGGTLADVLTHEWGHLLVNMAILRSYPMRRHAVGQESLLSAVEELSGCSRSSVLISLHAQINEQELLAESFVDFELHGAKAHPFSLALRMLLQRLWAC